MMGMRMGCDLFRSCTSAMVMTTMLCFLVFVSASSTKLRSKGEMYSADLRIRGQYLKRMNIPQIQPLISQQTFIPQLRLKRTSAQLWSTEEEETAGEVATVEPEPSVRNETSATEDDGSNTPPSSVTEEDTNMATEDDEISNAATGGESPDSVDIMNEAIHNMKMTGTYFRDMENKESEVQSEMIKEGGDISGTVDLMRDNPSLDKLDELSGELNRKMKGMKMLHDDLMRIENYTALKRPFDEEDHAHMMASVEKLLTVRNELSKRQRDILANRTLSLANAGEAAKAAEATMLYKSYNASLSKLQTALESGKNASAEGVEDVDRAMASLSNATTKAKLAALSGAAVESFRAAATFYKSATALRGEVESTRTRLNEARVDVGLPEIQADAIMNSTTDISVEENEASASALLGDAEALAAEGGEEAGSERGILFGDTKGLDWVPSNETKGVIQLAEDALDAAISGA
eukprot:g1910.t1